MANEIFKILIFLKRKPGLSLAEFQDYYETRHSQMSLKYARGLKRYTRRYISPVPNDETGASGELDFDVITELTFEDRAVFEKVLEMGTSMVLPADIREDEEKLFDRSKTRYASAVKTQTDLSAVA